MNRDLKMPAAGILSTFGEYDGKGAQGEIAGHQRITELFRPLARQLTRFIDETLGVKGVLTAWREFLGRPGQVEWDEMRKIRSFLTAHQALLYNWTVFNLLYRPLPVDPSDPGADLPPDMTLAEVFLEINKHKLSPAETRVLRAIVRRPFSFAQVSKCIRNRGVVLRDILKQQEVPVSDPALSFLACEGDIYYCRMIGIDNRFFLFDAYSPVALPALQKPFIIALRKAITSESHQRISDATLLEYETIIRTAYVELCRGLFLPKPLFGPSTSDPSRVRNRTRP